MRRPGCDCIHHRQAALKAALRGLKRVRSRSCDLWQVCGGRDNKINLLSLAKLVKSKFLMCFLWSSIMIKTGLDLLSCTNFTKCCIYKKKKILRNVGILVNSKPHLTSKDMLPKAKDSVERSSRFGVVYQIPCRDCIGIYIGETERAYKTRLAENKRDLKPANLAKVDDNNFNKKTALVKHVITKDHRVDWDHSKILTFEIDFIKRRFLESFLFIILKIQSMIKKIVFVLKFMII